MRPSRWPCTPCGRSASPTPCPAACPENGESASTIDETPGTHTPYHQDCRYSSSGMMTLPVMKLSRMPVHITVGRQPHSDAGCWIYRQGRRTSACTARIPYAATCGMVPKRSMAAADRQLRGAWRNRAPGQPCSIQQSSPARMPAGASGVAPAAAPTPATPATAGVMSPMQQRPEV